MNFGDKMTTWQLKKPVQAVVFDCDSTLSSIEGIDELAKQHHVGSIVQKMTAEAMGSSGLNPILYQNRLNLVNPTREQVLKLGQLYYEHLTPDILAIICLLKRLNKEIYLLSSGLYPSIAIFGELLTIPSENIFAVDITFHEDGSYRDYDHASPLTHNDGKRAVIHKISKIYPNLVFIGDGLNDYSIHHLVTRFIGYGGMAYRANMHKLCDYYIRSKSMTPILPLILTPEETHQLKGDELNLYQTGLHALSSGEVKVK